MGFREILSALTERNREKKAMFKQAEAEMRIQEMLEERKLSANERELKRFLKEEREEQIKEELQLHRQARDEDIKFKHNPLDVENVTNHADWEVLKEKNLFAKGKMSLNKNDGSVLRNNPNLLKNDRRLFGI